MYFSDDNKHEDAHPEQAQDQHDSQSHNEEPKPEEHPAPHQEHHDDAHPEPKHDPAHQPQVPTQDDHSAPLTKKQQDLLQKFYNTEWPLEVKNSKYQFDKNLIKIRPLDYRKQNGTIYRQFYYVDPETQKDVIIYNQLWDNSNNPNFIFRGGK